MMRAAVMVGHGGPEMLVVRGDVAEPLCSVGQVRVKVTSSSVNNTDLWTREGSYGTAKDPAAIAGWRGLPIEVPRVQGADAVGVVERVGDGVDDELLGKRVLVDPVIYDSDSDEATLVGVIGSEVDGAFAEYLVVDADRVHDVSHSPLGDHELAALPTAYGTAMGMLRRAGSAAGETIVVTGASGGVGVGLVQLAAAMGMRVVALSTIDKSSMLHSLGASVVLDRHSDQVTADVLDAARGGVDVVADVVGGAQFTPWLGTLKPHGRIVVAGAVAGPIVSVDLRQLYLDQRCILGSSMHTPAAFRDLVAIANAGSISPPIASVFPLTAIHEAQSALRAPSTVGKIIIDVAP